MLAHGQKKGGYKNSEFKTYEVTGTESKRNRKRYANSKSGKQ